MTANNELERLLRSFRKVVKVFYDHSTLPLQIIRLLRGFFMPKVQVPEIDIAGEVVAIGKNVSRHYTAFLRRCLR